MKVRRILYFLYYLKELDRSKIQKIPSLCCKWRATGLHLFFILIFMYSSLKYNISILDYFYFRFYNLNREERGKWAGTGYLYEYQLHMNPKGAREVLENKIMFLNRFTAFTKRDFADINQVEGRQKIFYPKC